MSVCGLLRSTDFIPNRINLGKSSLLRVIVTIDGVIEFRIRAAIVGGEIQDHQRNKTIRGDHQRVRVRVRGDHQRVRPSIL